MTSMKWYLVKMVYQVVSGNGNHTPQFDEQFRMIKADELDWAWEKANVLGALGECNFLNYHRKEVKWIFIAVTDIQEIKAMEDGMQLFGRTEEPNDVEEYITLTKARSEHMMAYAKNSDHFMQTSVN